MGGPNGVENEKIYVENKLKFLTNMWHFFIYCTLQYYIWHYMRVFITILLLVVVSHLYIYSGIAQ